MLVMCKYYTKPEKINFKVKKNKIVMYYNKTKYVQDFQTNNTYLDNGFSFSYICGILQQ